MTKAQTGIDAFLSRLPFVCEFGIAPILVEPGRVIVEMRYQDRFSTPPGLFPASIVGAVGDVAAVSSCLTMVPAGHAVATLDFTIKMTNPARGERLRAEGRVLQHGRTISTAAADIWAGDGGDDLIHCGGLLATARSFKLTR